MRTDTPVQIRLQDYRPSDFLIDRVDLDVRLAPGDARITARLALRPNPAGRAGVPLVLDGDDLVLEGIDLDGEKLTAESYAATPTGLTLHAPPQGPFALTIATRVDPTANTRLMGLYRSNGVYCTQCEADGFRRITYFIDRPDVMAVYTTRIRLDRVAQDFTTMEGRSVTVAAYVEPGKGPRATYALDAVIRSMRWDEETFGRAYDLDVFNVVAVSDFNMGAMENKGLNLFNDKYVLASPETATDADYAAIERIIAHEYFHNWSGNRVTCRDWFQLCLKEGLTVFRDQEFSSDMRSRAVHRIGEVRDLRARQFPEDAGPLRHPVRPGTYAEINNFYTTTVYDKGAEIVRMLHTLIGAAAFRTGMDRYFADNDGRAATVEDFLAAFAAETGRGLSAFARWYERPGTPRLAVTRAYDAAAKRCMLTFRQSLEAAGPPLVIPVALGLVGASGPLDTATARAVVDGVLVLDAETATAVFENVAEPPVPSVLRGFSAPVRLDLELTDAERLILLRHDTDPFNRWQATQGIAMRLILEPCAPGAAEAFADAIGAFLDGEALTDPAFAALILALPSETEAAGEVAAEIDPDAIHANRVSLRRVLGTRLRPRLDTLLRALRPAEETVYSPDAASAGRRSLANACLDLIAAADPAAGIATALAQLRTARNMTDRLAALGVIAAIPGEAREAALAAFGETYADEPLVLDKWFAVQATIPEAGTPARIAALGEHPAFAMTNPNRVRALIGSFAMGNPTQFARSDGAGFELVAARIEALDGINPQLAARLLTAFAPWRRWEISRRVAADEILNRIKAIPSLSRDVADIVIRTLEVG